MTTTRHEILHHRTQGAWRLLEQRAQLLIGDARRHGGNSFSATLGGGTRLMLALNHRISDDIDLFVDSPGWLPFVSPRLNDRFDDTLSGYNEDNIHVKLRFEEGEIDFVVSAPLLPESKALWNPPASETSLPLEAPAEVLAKKLFYRGWALNARDLFDWVSLYHEAPADAIPEQDLAKLLASKLDGIKQALTHLGQRETQEMAWNHIRSPALPDLAWAVQWALAKTTHWNDIATGKG